MRKRDDRKLIEDWTITFAMYCDENSMPRVEREELAEEMADAIQSEAEWFNDEELAGS